MKVLIDTNIILDYALIRQPFYDLADRIFVLADALRLYKMKAANKEVEIIANLDRIYELKDIVAIAQSD